jgi:hypothetical protein
VHPWQRDYGDARTAVPFRPTARGHVRRAASAWNPRPECWWDPSLGRANATAAGDDAAARVVRFKIRSYDVYSLIYKHPQFSAFFNAGDPMHSHMPVACSLPSNMYDAAAQHLLSKLIHKAVAENGGADGEFLAAARQRRRNETGVAVAEPAAGDTRAWWRQPANECTRLFDGLCMC